MTANDHNRTLALAHGLVGALFLVGLTIAAVIELREVAHTENTVKIPKEIYLLAIPLLQLATAYGLFRRQRWGRVLAIVFSALYAFVFPLGTLLAIYTWGYMHSAGARKLYAKSAS